MPFIPLSLQRRRVVTAAFADDWPEPDALDGEPWQDRALCAQADPEAFFPEKGGVPREAKRTCSRCPVRAECLAYALAHDIRFGVWGGLAERDRRKLRSAHREAAVGAVVGAA